MVPPLNDRLSLRQEDLHELTVTWTAVEPVKLLTTAFEQLPDRDVCVLVLRGSDERLVNDQDVVFEGCRQGNDAP